MEDTIGVSLRKNLPAGIIDAALNSLASFVVGLVAARMFEPALLGVFAVFFTAHSLGHTVPTYLIYVPAEVQAVSWPVEQRIRVVYRSTWLGMGPSLLAGIAILLAILVVRSQASASELAALGWTTAAATFLAPAQAHVRRMQHIAGLSWRAAVTSGMQLVAAGAGLALLLGVDVPVAWVPFGALALANAVSIGVGLFLSRGGRPTPDRLRLSQVVKAGRWLVVSGVVPAAALFVVASLISHLASPEQLGFAEAARVAAQPVLVLGVGLNAVLGPRSMEAAHHRDRRAARRMELLTAGIVLAATAGYLLLAGGAWGWNPLYHLVPKAYEVAGLAALMIVAHALGSIVLAARSELLGGRMEKKLTLIETLSSLASIVVACTAGVSLAFARPWSLLSQNLWRAIHYRRALLPLYRTAPATEAPGDEAPPWEGLVLDGKDS